MSGGAARRIAHLGCGEPHFDLWGDRLIYIDHEGMLVWLNLSDDTSTRSGPHCAGASYGGVVISCAGFSGFSADERYAFWAKAQSFDPIRTFDIWGFDTATRSAFVAAANLSQDPNNFWPEMVVAGRTLAWIHRSSGQMVELRYGPLAAVLPAAAEPQPASDVGSTVLPRNAAQPAW